MQLLASGPKVVSVYADASFFEALRLGCWAYMLPGLAVDDSGVEDCESNNHIEFAAAVRGLLVATALDHSPRKLCVFSDSEFAIALLNRVAERSPFPNRKSHRGVRHLFDSACDATVGRLVTVQRRGRRDPHHRACDRRAREHLRRHCCADGRIARTLLLKRAQAQRLTYVKEIQKLEQTLTGLERKLLQCDVEIAALEYTSTESRTTLMESNR